MEQELWYKNAVIYSLDLETFMDANGDGTGDFEGLCNRLDYLHALGVDTIWLAPFQPSPNKDNGYDITDYYGVDPRHGSGGEFVDFIYKAKKLGIKVIIDLVVNHTSDKHPWFVNACTGKDARHRDWYVWSDKKPPKMKEGMVFPGVQHTTWTYEPQTKSYYFHRFFHHQPDLNTDNPEVRKEIERIMGFWLQLGVDGFRVDAVPFILEAPSPGKEANMRFEYLKQMRRFLQWRKGDAVFLGEANVLPEESKDYFGKDGDGIHMMFNFYVNQYMFYSLATANTKPLVDALKKTRGIFPYCQWAQFLRNHDELDLGRLSDEERAIVFEKYGPEENMQIYERGIRRRLAPMLGSRPQLELAYSIMFSLPGTPVIRYGDEIGMGENLNLKEREAIRTPMQWSDEKNSGFSAAEKLIHPIISQGFFSYKHVNVEIQRRDPNSLLNWMTAMIRLRKECPEIGHGDWEMLKTGYDHILGMAYKYRGNSLYIFHNFTDAPQEIIINKKQIEHEKLIDLMQNETSLAKKDGSHKIALEAYGYKWFRADNLSSPYEHHTVKKLKSKKLKWGD